MDKKDRREPFIRFLNLQKHDDLLLWCRIRQLLTDSYTGFKQVRESERERECVCVCEREIVSVRERER